MSILLDTNLLLRILQPAHRHHSVAKAATTALLRSNVTVHIVPQNLYECWVVATRPVEKNGLGVTTPEAAIQLADFRSAFSLLPDPPTLANEWQDLVTQYDVKGKPAHDARLVAAMHLHQIPKLLTFNPGDFSRYPTIQVISPAEVLSP